MEERERGSKVQTNIELKYNATKQKERKKVRKKREQVKKSQIDKEYERRRGG